MKCDFDFNFRAGNFIFKIPKSFSLISFESQFETPKFEISDFENPEILIFASKFKLFFDQKLDFVLGTKALVVLQIPGVAPGLHLRREFRPFDSKKGRNRFGQ